MDAGNGQGVAGIEFLDRQMRKIIFVRKRAPAGKEGAVPVLASDIEALDVIAVLMSNEKSRDVVCREPQFCHAL